MIQATSTHDPIRPTSKQRKPSFPRSKTSKILTNQ
jgi:hypothetical protein